MGLGPFWPLYLDHQITRKEAAARLGVSVSTFDKWLKVSKGQEEAVMHVDVKSPSDARC